MQTCGKHAIGNRLGIDVGKGFRRNVVDKDLLERLHVSLQFGCLFVLVTDCAVLDESLFDNVAEQSCFACHQLC